MSGPVIEKLKNDPNTRSKMQLNALLEITKAINSNFPASDLFRIFEFLVGEQLDIHKFAFCSYDIKWNWAAEKGTQQETSKIKPEFELTIYRELTFINEATPDSLKGFQIIIPVHHKTKALAYILLGGMDYEQIEEIRENDLEFIQTISNIIAVAIENKRLFKENLHQELLKKEMEMGKEVQAMLFPKNLPSTEALQVAAFYQPMRQVGGDYYDFIKVTDEISMICMADVSGKGVSAALLMANFQAHLRSLAELYPNDLKTVVTKLNQRVIQNAAGEKFITMFLAAYNESTRELQYVNAGHNPPALCSDSHTAILETGTTGLGMIDELSPFEAVNVHIPKGSLLVCYTDGLVEQENAKGEDFGLDKLIEIMQQSSDLKAADFNDELLTQLLIHKGDKPYFDDIALLTCRF